MKLAENCNPTFAFLPVNMATAANTGDWICLKNYHRCLILLLKDGGAAGEDPTITLQQATDNAGTGEKALTVITEVYYKQTTDLTDDTDSEALTFTRTTQTAASTYTDTTSAEDEAIWMIDIKTDLLDVDNGFDYIQASVADVGDTSQIGTVLYIPYEPRYSGQACPAVIT
jgi:hypothetical protein